MRALNDIFRNHFRWPVIPSLLAVWFFLLDVFQGYILSQRTWNRMPRFGLQLERSPAWGGNRRKCGGFKCRSGSDLDCLPLQLFMAGLRLLLSTHASLFPVCKAPVSTSALYQPLFVGRAESHTSNTLAFGQILPSDQLQSFAMRRSPLLLRCTHLLPVFQRQTFPCFQRVPSATRFVFR